MNESSPANAKGYSKQSLISIFILLHVTFLAYNAIHWSCGLPQIWPVKAYINLFGLYQNWMMFEKAPAADYYLCAVIEMNDGKKSFVEFEHMDDLQGWARLRSHRFRKFQQTYLFNPRNAMLYPDVCRWIVRNAAGVQGAQVKSITLYQKELALISREEKMHPFCQMKGPFQ